MPNKELLEAWVNVLEDPESQQAWRMLATKKGGKCCLGHLAGVVGVELIPDHDRNEDDLSEGGFYCKLNLPDDEKAISDDFLPDEAWKLLDIPETQQHYAEFNDHSGMTLKEIATHIRTTYLEKKDAE